MADNRTYMLPTENLGLDLMRATEAAASDAMSFRAGRTAFSSSFSQPGLILKLAMAHAR